MEVLQRKFDEFQKDMAAQEYRVSEVNEIADKLILEGHSERETIAKRKEVSGRKCALRDGLFNIVPFIDGTIELKLFSRN